MQQGPLLEDKFMERVEVEKDSNFNFGALFWGLIVISLGLAYLGDSYGAINLNFGVSFSAFWAICLMALGLSVFSTREWLSFSLGFFTTMMAFLVVMISVLVIGQNSFFDVSKRFVFEKYDGVDKIVLNMNQTAGKLDINGGLERFLLEGFFESNFTNFDIKNKREGSTQILSMSSGDFFRGIGSYYKNMSFMLNKNFVYDFNLYSNTANVDFNLTEVQVQNMNLDIYATNMYVFLGDKSPNVNLVAKTNASRLSIYVPLNVGVEVVHKTNNVTSLDYSSLIRINDTTYRSPNYSSAEKIVHIVLESTISEFNIIR